MNQLKLLKTKLGESLNSNVANGDPLEQNGDLVSEQTLGSQSVGDPLSVETRQSYEGVFIQIPLKAIVVGGVNARREFAEDRMAELRESIQTDGLLQPLVVVPEPEHPNQWHLLAGERRFRTVRDMGWETVPARVVMLPRNKWRRVMMQENLQQESFSLAEQIRGFVDMVEKDGYSIPDIITELHLDKGYVYGLFRLYNNQRLRQAITDGLINGKKILKPINRLITRKGEERYPGLVDRVLRFMAKNNPSVAEMQDKITDLINEVERASEIVSNVPSRRVAGSIWEKERQRLQSFVSKSVRNLDTDAIRELAQVYQSVAQDLTKMADDEK